MSENEIMFFKVPEVPKEPVPEEKVPVAVPKIPEPVPSEGLCHHSYYCKGNLVLPNISLKIDVPFFLLYCM